MKKEKRFIVKENQSLVLGAICIIVDTNNSVNCTAQTRITPLLDVQGNVVIEK